uniref:Aminopeptidase P N-terminal domain-containing protein n=1 Tax=Setaria digitata TaxID=48799 RepID=A0A915Q3N2_9BILA
MDLINRKTNKKLDQFRVLFTRHDVIKGVGGSIDAYLLPSTDSHQSEYISERDFRVRFLTGFSGSNAFALITLTEALVWTDGRYFIQAQNELESGWKMMKEGVPDAVSTTDWMIQNLKKGSRVAFDPQLCRHAEALRLMDVLGKVDIIVLPLKGNLVDYIWNDRPEECFGQILMMKEDEHGMESSKKIEKVRHELHVKGCNTAIFTSLDDVAWLLNIRGSDIPYNPVVFAIIFMTPDEVHLFISKKKLNNEIRSHLASIIIHEYNEAAEWIGKWLQSHKGQYKVCIPDLTNYELGSLVETGDGVSLISPIQFLKAVKNETELSGMRKSSIRDSAAIIEYITWLEGEIIAGKEITEAIAGKKMDEFRRKQPLFVDLSFETIAAVNEHAALPHYSSTAETSKQLLTKTSIFLLDSGGHYRDGTTDVTRTVAFPDNKDMEFRRMFTLVLKGHIANAMLIFPDGVNGIRMDALSRQYLWSHGLDFQHGVGHGVGHFLNVHEGPIGITFRKYEKEGGIHKGNVITIEPGFYVEGKWGIRIENCYEVVTADKIPSKAGNFLAFSPLTFVPIQKSLVDKTLLSPQEIEWFNHYHTMCLEKIGPYLLETNKKKEYEWLKNACASI